MDNTRLFLYASLALVLLLLWGAWVDFRSPPAGQPGAVEEDAAPEREQARRDDIPELPSDITTADEAVSPIESERGSHLPSRQRIQVRTDVLDIELDTAGGDIRRALLLEYPLHKDEPDRPFPLLADDNAALFVFQGGLVAADDRAPNHHSTWQAERNHYTLQEGRDELRVPLHWENGDGLRVTRTYVFRRGDYLIDIEYRVENDSASPWRGSQYLQYQRNDIVQVKPSWFVHTFMGPAIHDGERYNRISFEDVVQGEYAADHRGGWAAMVQHYFIGAAIPPADGINHYYTRMLDGPRYVVGTRTPAVQLEPGAATTLEAELWLGPKLQKRIKEVAPGLERTVDYGWLTFLSQPLFWVLDKIHLVTNNWGWAIIFLTILIKLAFYKLSETSYRSMAKMREVQPRLKTLQERYKDDRQRLNQAMMEMYKKEKINPLGGCLPILVQIPVFIALYWVLLESVELRQAPWALWINDLSSRDPYYVLPVLMGLSMYLQQKLNPVPMEPVQQKVMAVLPFVFTIFFAFFPSGLVLYWLVNNILSLAQQWYITRNLELKKKAS